MDFFSSTSMFDVGRLMFDVQGAHCSSAPDRTWLRKMSRKAVCLIIGFGCCVLRPWMESRDANQFFNFMFHDKSIFVEDDFFRSGGAYYQNVGVLLIRPYGEDSSFLITHLIMPPLQKKRLL